MLHINLNPLSHWLEEYSLILNQTFLWIDIEYSFVLSGVLLEQSGPLARLRPSLLSQWELISQFQSKLISGAERALLRTDITPEVDAIPAFQF